MEGACAWAWGHHHLIEQPLAVDELRAHARHLLRERVRRPQRRLRLLEPALRRRQRRRSAVELRLRLRQLVGEPEPLPLRRLEMLRR